MLHPFCSLKEVPAIKSFEENLLMAKQIAKKVKECGGNAYFVGGFVRDMLMHRETKDIDIEIHGISENCLDGILDSLGRRTETGKSFGVRGLSGYGLDIAMPRTERKTGCGHRDFEVSVDPFIGIKKAAKRRDFTINSIMQDICTEEIIDIYGGIDDINKGIIRCVSKETFSEDALRVYRAAQFASRFGFVIEPLTVEICKGIDTSALSRERVFAELEKALLKSDKPSVFFDSLRKMEKLGDFFKEVGELIGVAQSPEHHREGDVYNHTMLVLDFAAKEREKSKNKMGFMLSALVHDFGKIETTQVIDGKIRAFDHENAGAILAKNFLHRITNEKKLIHYAVNMTQLHMRPNMLAAQNSSAKAFAKLFDLSCEPSDLILLAKCDRNGSLSSNPKEDFDKILHQKLDFYNELIKKPCVTGKDLIKSGISPGTEFGQLLEYAHKLHLAGVKKDDALRSVMAIHRKNHSE